MISSTLRQPFFTLILLLVLSGVQTKVLQLTVYI